MHINIKIKINKLKIYYYSDLHLEFRENRMSVSNKMHKIKNSEDSIAILAGDIVYISGMQSDRVLKNFCNKFKEVYIICGNHEFYLKSGDAKILETSFITEFNNVKLVNNISVNIGDYNFIFSTMFSQIHPNNEFWILRGMNDFSQMLYDGKSLTVNAFNEINNKCINYIKTAIESSQTENNIIVTHYLPSELLIQKRFKGNILNEAFYVDLHNFIFDNSNKIKYWIYGHNHHNADYEIENTKLICNQFGYVSEGLMGFDFNKHIEI